MGAPFFSIMTPRLHELNWNRDHLIFYLLRGSAHLMVDTREYTLTAEDFIAVEPGALYTFSYGRDVRLLQLTMPDELLRQLTKAPQGRRIQCFSGDHAQSLSGIMSDVRRRLANLFDLQYSAPDPNELLFTGRAILLYDFLYANCSVYAAEGVSDRGAGVYDYLCAAYAYAQEHACDAAKLTDAAAHIGVTPEYLSRSLRKYMNVSYTDLVHQERMRRGLSMLRDTDRTIADIGLSLGYSGSSAFISAFKSSYGITPKYFRTHLTDNIPGQSLRVQDVEVYDSIRKYIHHDTQEDIASGGLNSVQREIDVRADAPGQPFYDGWSRVMVVCNASDILKSTIQRQIRDARRDFGAEYLYFHDVFNDDMMIYEEDKSGRPMYNFRNLDAILRFLTAQGLKPYIELSFMPMKLARRDTGELRFLNRMNVTPPTDWDKWEALVRTTLEFCVKQYGMDRVKTWRFTSAMLYNVHLHGLLTLEDYLEIYLRTHRAVKAVCPGAAFTGPGTDVTLAAADWDHTMRPFLRFCERNNCLPDLISLRLYPIDYQKFTRREVNALRDSRAKLKRCPNYFVEENYAHRALQSVVERLAEAGYPREKICIDRWNGNISQTDPVNDTCWKSAYIVKTVLENRDLAASLTYWSLSDSMSHLDLSFAESDLAGSLGLMTYEGLKKSAYYAMMLLCMLHGEVLTEAPGHIVLRHGDGYLVMIYQYCHYDRDAIENMLSRQTLIDPYMMCDSGERRVYSVKLSHVPRGRYRAEYFSVGRRSGGNLYENWRRLGYTEVINGWQRSYLEGVSLPAYRVGTIAAEDHTLQLSCVVEPHDVILIRLSPDEREV